MTESKFEAIVSVSGSCLLSCFTSVKNECGMGRGEVEEKADTENDVNGELSTVSTVLFSVRFSLHSAFAPDKHFLKLMMQSWCSLSLWNCSSADT